MKTATAFVLFTLLTPLAAQQESAEPPPFVLEAGEIKLTDLIDRCAHYLQWNILGSGPELAACPLQEIRTQIPMSVDRDGCVELLSTMLTRGGFVLTELDAQKKVYEIINLTGPRAREIQNRAVRRDPVRILAQPTLRMPVTTVVELKHVNAVIATNALRPFFASVGGGPQSSLTIGNVGSPSSLLISGLQDQVAMAIEMVQKCDVPPPPEVEPKDADRIAGLEQRLAALEQAVKALEKPATGVR